MMASESHVNSSVSVLLKWNQEKNTNIRKKIEHQNECEMQPTKQLSR